MVHILFVFITLLLIVSVLQWHKFFLLDEFAEYPKAVLEVLRQLLEDRIISISRAKQTTDHSDISDGIRTLAPLTILFEIIRLLNRCVFLQF